MHDNPRPTEEEQELAQQEPRQEEEEAMRGGGAFHDPDAEREKSRDGGER
jgi:hypothetical protein